MRYYLYWTANNDDLDLKVFDVDQFDCAHIINYTEGQQ